MVSVDVSGARHCSMQSCHQLDFLPFRCDACHKDFCQDHFAYACHGCPYAAARSVQVLLCPLCQETVRIDPDEDPNVTWEKHFTSTCRQAPKAKPKKRRCPVPGCKEQLGLTNSFECKRCGQTVCMTHRLQEDHPCDARNANAASKNSAPTGSSKHVTPVARMLGCRTAVSSTARVDRGSDSRVVSAQISDDARLARELQEQEMYEASRAAPRDNRATGHVIRGERPSMFSGLSSSLSGQMPGQSSQGQTTTKPKKKLSQRIASMVACFKPPKRPTPEERERLR